MLRNLDRSNRKTNLLSWNGVLYALFYWDRLIVDQLEYKKGFELWLGQPEREGQRALDWSGLGQELVSESDEEGGCREAGSWEQHLGELPYTHHSNNLILNIGEDLLLMMKWISC